MGNGNGSPHHNRIATIQKDRATGDFRIDYAFGVTVNLKKDSDDWLDLHELLEDFSPSGIYERQEVKP